MTSAQKSHPAKGRHRRVHIEPHPAVAFLLAFAVAWLLAGVLVYRYASWLLGLS